VIRLSSVLSSSEVAEVEEFLEHAELGEALRTLAWIIVEENRQVSAVDLEEIQSLAQRMEMSDELPDDLADHAAGSR
jgi:hypothetical protein